MYRGENPTALESMDAIASALLELACCDSLREITVREVCTAAERSRQTFYQLFDSKEDVLVWRFWTLFAEFADQVGSDTCLHDLALLYFRFWRMHTAFLDALANSQLHHLMVSAFEEVLPRVGAFSEATRDLPNTPYAAIAVAGMLANMLLRWREEGYGQPEEELASLVESILRGRVFDLG